MIIRNDKDLFVIRIFNNYIEKGYNEHFDNKSIKEILEEIDLQYDIDKSIDEVEIGR